jgi:hypothetical protein
MSIASKAFEMNKLLSWEKTEDKLLNWGYAILAIDRSVLGELEANPQLSCYRWY